MSLDAHLEALSCREAALLAHALATDSLRALERRITALPEPEPLLDLLVTWNRSAPEQRDRLRHRLESAFASHTPRAAAVHPSWVEDALRTLPPSLREDARPWLTLGRGPDALTTGQRWLFARCRATFPLGPTHLGPPGPAHPGGLALLPERQIEPFLEEAGLLALAIALADSEPRRAAAVVAALPDETRRARFAELSRTELPLSHNALRTLRLRLQSVLLERRPEPTPLEEVPDLLALHLIALAGGSRFDRDLEFLAVRLPHERGRALLSAIAQSTRRGPALATNARLVLGEPLAALQAQDLGSPDHPSTD